MQVVQLCVARQRGQQSADALRSVPLPLRQQGTVVEHQPLHLSHPGKLCWRECNVSKVQVHEPCQPLQLQARLIPPTILILF